MGEITHFLPWQMSSRGIFDEKGYFNSTMGEMETCTYCVKYEERHSPPPTQKGDFFFFFIKVRLWRPSSYFVEDDDAVFSVISPLDPVFFTGPQTESCKSIKSSERSTGFGCDNDLRKTTNGEGTCLTHTYTHAR